MSYTIKTISLPMPFRLGRVNCYLMETAQGFILIDTGCKPNRVALEKELFQAGCEPGKLSLLLITHGDYDHTGNAAYLRRKFGARLAMHPADAGMLEHGDMFWNRKKGNRIIRALAPKLMGFGRAERCSPDVSVEDGADLNRYGLDARVIAIAGHSSGSIGVLTARGDLFCGDLIDNTHMPALSAIMDDIPTATLSLEKLRSLGIRMVYPGHGKPFPMAQFNAR